MTIFFDQRVKITDQNRGVGFVFFFEQMFGETKIFILLSPEKWQSGLMRRS